MEGKTEAILPLVRQQFVNKDDFLDHAASFPPKAMLTGRSCHRFMDEISKLSENSLATGLEILMPGWWELINNNKKMFMGNSCTELTLKETLKHRFPNFSQGEAAHGACYLVGQLHSDWFPIFWIPLFTPKDSILPPLAPSTSLNLFLVTCCWEDR